MEDTEKVTKGIEAAKEMVEKLGKTFNELESCREALLPSKTQWGDIKEHFDNLEKLLQEKMKEVEEKEKVLKEKQSEAHKLVAERETSVAVKELASLDRLQELKDAAVSAIAEARKNCMVPTPVLVDAKGSKDNKLTESFPPVPLLKEYLNNVKGIREENTADAAAVGEQKDVSNKEMGALRVIIKCIEEYKLQEEYPVDPLKKRVAQLEKAKYDKKRMGQTTKIQAKKPRANGGYASRKPAMLVDNRPVPPPVYDERRMYPGIAERYSERYGYAAPPPYEVASHAPYAQQPSAQRRPYHYPDERVAPPAPYSSSSNYGTTNYGSYAGTGYQSSTPNTYGNYIGAGVQSASPNYGSYMGAGGGQPSHQSYM